MLKYINRVANELQISPVLLEEAWHDFLIQTKRTLEDPDMPKILIHGFGTFKVGLPRIENKIRETIKKYRKGILTKESATKTLEKLFTVRRRLKNETKTKSRNTQTED